MQELIFEIHAGGILGLGILALACIIYWKSPEHDEIREDKLD